MQAKNGCQVRDTTNLPPLLQKLGSATAARRIDPAAVINQNEAAVTNLHGTSLETRVCLDVNCILMEYSPGQTS